MGKQIPAALLAALIAALLLAACGDSGEEDASAGRSGADNGAAGADSGSAATDQGTEAPDADSSEDSETATIAKAEFIRRAEGICAATLQKITTTTFPIIEEEQKKPDYNQKALEARLAAEVMGPELRAEAEELEALGLPPGDEAKVKAIVDGIYRVAGEAEENPRALITYKSEGLQKPTELAERYGLDQCPYG